MDVVHADKVRLQAQIKELQSNGQSEKELHAWQHDKLPGEAQTKGYSFVVLMIVAVISLIVGHYLTGGRSNATNSSL